MNGAVSMTSMSSYAILGCGSVGHAVAEELVTGDKDVLILDRDEGRVEALRDQDLDARTADIRDRAVVEAIADRDVVLILSSDVEANRVAVESIRAANDEKFIVARASDPVTADELREVGADVVINPSAVIADSALRALEQGELEHRAERLAEVVGDGERLAVLAHRSPGPDSIASAVALQAIAEAKEVEADILYEGEIGHQENRAFVNLLGIELSSLGNVDLDDYDTLALVDCAKASDPVVDVDVDVFIDHFEPEVDYGATFTDVRPNVSSTSTILTKYVQEFDLSLPEAVATALLYGRLRSNSWTYLVRMVDVEETFGRTSVNVAL